MKPRALIDAEARLLHFLIEACSEGRDQLLQQARHVRTAGSSCDCGCPSFYLNPKRSHACVELNEPVAVSAHGRDPGGIEVGVMLFVTEGYLSEVEVFAWTGSTYAGLPRPEDLKISIWSELDENGVSRLLNAE